MALEKFSFKLGSRMLKSSFLFGCEPRKGVAISFRRFDIYRRACFISYSLSHVLAMGSRALLISNRREPRRCRTFTQSVSSTSVTVCVSSVETVCYEPRKRIKKTAIRLYALCGGRIFSRTESESVFCFFFSLLHVDSFEHKYSGGIVFLFVRPLLTTSVRCCARRLTQRSNNDS